MIIVTEREFQKKFVGTILLYQYRKRHRNLVFLPRNLRRFLTYHQLKLEKKRQKVRPSGMSTSSDAGNTTRCEPLQRVSVPWSIQALSQSLKDNLTGPESPVLRVELKGFSGRKESTKRNSRCTQPPLKRIKTTSSSGQCALTIWDSRFPKGDGKVKQNRSCRILIDKSDPEPKAAIVEMDEPFLVRADELLSDIHGKKWEPGQTFTMQISLLQGTSHDAWPPIPMKKIPPPKLSKIMEAGGEVRFPILMGKWSKLPECPEAGKKIEMFAYQDGKTYKPKLVMDIAAAWAAAPSPLTIHNTRMRNTLVPPPRLPTPVSESNLAAKSVTVRWTFEGPWSHIEDIELNGYLCPLCNGLDLNSLDPYHFHLINMHDLFKFRLIWEGTATEEGQQKIVVEVRVDVNPTADNSIPAHDFVWDRLRSFFDLEAFLKGDETWLGKENRKSKERKRSGVSSLATPHLESSRSASREFLRADAPSAVRSRAAKDVPDIPVSNRKKFRVPMAPQGIKFFRLTAKRPLEEGELISESDDEMDESWLLQKHQETIESFDITDPEKNFIKLYDSHMLTENLSSSVHFREALVRFCRINRIWLRKKEMRIEFHKNVAKLLLQGIVDERLVRDCIGIITEDESQGDLDAMDISSENKAAESRVTKESTRAPAEAIHDCGKCKCGSRIYDMRNYICCSNIICKAPDHHLQCTKLSERTPDWICGACAPERLTPKAKIPVKISPTSKEKGVATLKLSKKTIFSTHHQGMGTPPPSLMPLPLQHECQEKAFSPSDKEVDTPRPKQNPSLPLRKDPLANKVGEGIPNFWDDRNGHHSPCTTAVKGKALAR